MKRLLLTVLLCTTAFSQSTQSGLRLSESVGYTSNIVNRVDSYRYLTFTGNYGFSYGNSGFGDVEPAWSTDMQDQSYVYFNRPGISQNRSSVVYKHAYGDFAYDYPYFYSVGGLTAGADEGSSMFSPHHGELPAYFQATLGVGAVPGANNLQISPDPTFDTVSCSGCWLVDKSQPYGAGYYTGVPTQSGSSGSDGAYYWSIPVSITLTPSTYATLTCLSGNITIPVVSDPTVPELINCTAHLMSGSGSAFTVTSSTVGATLSGGFTEQVQITSVGPVSGTDQPITLLHLKPHLADNSMLWQGGPQGTVETADYYATFDQLPTMMAPQLPAASVCFGAIDSSHLACAANIKGLIAQPPTMYVVPLPLINLVRTGGIVTATSYNKFDAAYNNATADVTSGCAGFSGTFEPLTESNGTLTWPQAGTDASCASASLSLPQAQFGFHLYPYATQLDSDLGGLPGDATHPLDKGMRTVEPNHVPWAPGDIVFEPHLPFGGTGILDVAQYFQEDSGNNIAEWTMGLSGMGVSGGFQPVSMTNASPGHGCTDRNNIYYLGCGGVVSPPTWFNVHGPNNGLFNVDAPMNGQYLIKMNCPESGCNSNFLSFLSLSGVGYIQVDQSNNRLVLNQKLLLPSIPTGIPTSAACFDISNNLIKTPTGNCFLASVNGQVSLSGGVASLPFPGPYTSVPIPVCSDATSASAVSCSATLSGGTATVTFAGTGSDTINYIVSLSSPLVLPPGPLVANDADTIIGSIATTWTDSSGNYNTLTGAGNPVVVANAINAHSAVRFDGATTYFNAASDVNCTVTCTIYMLYRPDDLSANHTMTTNHTGGHGLAFSTNPSAQMTLSVQYLHALGSDTNQLYAGAWYRMAVTYSGGTATYYLNGVAGTTYSATYTPDPFNRLGANFNPGSGVTEEFAKGLLNYFVAYAGPYNPAVDAFLASR